MTGGGADCKQDGTELVTEGKGCSHQSFCMIQGIMLQKTKVKRSSCTNELLFETELKTLSCRVGF